MDESAIDHVRRRWQLSRSEEKVGNAQNRVAIAGVGYSTIGRHLPSPTTSLFAKR